MQRSVSWREDVTLPCYENSIVKFRGSFEEKKQEEFLFPILHTDREYPMEAKLKQAISARNAYFNKVLRVITTKAGIQKKVSMHVARHSFATISISIGVSLEVLSKLLGHSDLKTTQIYGKIMDKQKDEAMGLWDQV
jgi:site-specific recombinase XerD